MKNTALLCSFLCSILFSSLSTAQVALKPSDNAPTIDLKTALASAYSQSTKLKISQNFVEQSKARQRRALAGYLPKLQLGVANNFNLPVAEITIGDDEPVTITISPLWVLDLQLTLTQPIFDKSVLSAIEISKMETEQAQKELIRNQSELSRTVIDSYYNAAKAKLALDVWQNAISRTRALLDRAQKRYTLNLARKADVNRLKLELVKAQEAQDSAKSNYEFALGALGMVIGRSERFEVTHDDAVRTIESMGADELIKRAYSFNKELDSQKGAIELARKNHDRVYDSFYPTLSAQAQGLFTTNATGLSASALRSVFLIQGTWTLYDGGDRYGRMRETKSAMHSEEIKLQDIKIRIEADVRGKLEHITNKSNLVGKAKQKLKLQTDIYADAQKSFYDGLIETSEVINLAHDLNDYELGERQAKLELNFTRLQLAHMAGELDSVL